MQELEYENLDASDINYLKCEFLVNKYFPDGFNLDAEMKVIKQQEQMKRLEEDVNEKTKSVQLAREEANLNGQKEYKKKERELQEQKRKLETLKASVLIEREGKGQEKEKKSTIEIHEETFIPAREQIKQLVEKSKENARELDEIHKFKKIREEEKNFEREKKARLQHNSSHRQQYQSQQSASIRPATTGVEKNYQISLTQGLDSIYSQY